MTITFYLGKKNSYGEYTSQGYETISLFSKSGDSTDTIIEDCAPIPTPALDKLPKIRSFLENSNLSLMWVRLNKLATGTCFWEHRDYSELSDADKVRLHVPISTSPDSYMVFQSEAIHLKPDNLWLLRPDSDAHGFINGSSVRIHLIIDAYVNDELRKEINSSYLPKENIVQLQKAKPEAYERLLSIAARLFEENRENDAVEMLLKTFLKYDQPLGLSYDLVISLYEKFFIGEKVQEWINRKHRFLHQEELANVKRK